MSRTANASQTRIARAEWVLVGVWTAVALLAIAAPYWDGYRRAPAGWRFDGFVGGYPDDYYGYLAWMRQARDGFVLFKDYFTTEPHGRVFFHPLFWAMGTMSRLTGAPLLIPWYVVHAFGCGLLLVTVYRFAAHFTPDAPARVLALALVTTSTGFGWLTAPTGTTPWIARSIDLWHVETDEFRALTSSFFTLPVALTCMLLAFLHALRYLRTARRTDAVASGVYALALVATHQYDIVVLYAVLGAYVLVAARRHVARVAIVAVPSLLYCLYSVAVVRLDPVFAQHVHVSMRTPTPLACALGWGLPLVLAAIALLTPAVWRSGRDLGFLAVWLVVGMVLLALPLGFARKLMWGMHVPMCVLGAMLVVEVLRSAGRALPRRAATAVVVAGSILVTIAAGIGTVPLYRNLFVHPAPPAVGDYLPDDYLEALRWLDDHTEPAEVVLASLPLAALIPGYTGCVTFVGHWAQTVDPNHKAAFVAALFGVAGGLPPTAIRGILARNRVHYLFLDRWARDLARIPLAQREFPFSSVADVVYENPFATIWRVRDAGQSPPWDDGDWRGAGTHDR